jgi:AcrR family transcriptional regulator
LTTVRIDEAPAPENERSTADRIAVQAADLFADKGFAGTSIREIAAAAGVTKPTVYYYFGSKDGLIRHIINGAMRQFIEAVADARGVCGELQAQLQTLVRGQLDWAVTHPALVVLVGRCTHEARGFPWADDLHRLQAEALEATAGLFRDAIASGQAAPRAPELLTLTLFGSLMSLSAAALRSPENWDATGNDKIASDLVGLLLDGARSRRGDGDALEEE